MPLRKKSPRKDTGTNSLANFQPGSANNGTINTLSKTDVLQMIVIMSTIPYRGEALVSTLG